MQEVRKVLRRPVTRATLPTATCAISHLVRHIEAPNQGGRGRYRPRNGCATAEKSHFGRTRPPALIMGGRRMPRAPEPIWEPSANASREKHATPRVKELLTARWDAVPGNADEFRHERIEELFKADPDRVIRPAELAAVVVFAPGESVWGTFTTEDAAELFKAIEAHSAVRG